MSVRHVLLALGSGVAFSLGLAMLPLKAAESITYTYDALGRLVVAQSAGSVNDDETHSLCFDAAGNRTKYRSDDAGAVASCAPSPSSMPSPSGPASSANTAPTAVSDSDNMSYHQTKLIDVVANDTDAEGDTPLVLTAASVVSGNGTVSLASATQVQVTYNYYFSGTVTISYQITDARGATATGQLTVQ